MALTLFDLDHTLLDGDTNALWLSYLVSRALLPAEVLQQQEDYMARYQAEQLDIADYLAFQLGLLAPISLEAWEPVRHEFVRTIIAPRVSMSAWQAIATHCARGDRMVIMTATHSFLADLIGEMLGLRVIAPKAAQRDGHLTGEIDGPICFRDQKLVCLKVWLAEQELDASLIDEARFYSDSINDLPTLEAVAEPIVVNGDKPLTIIARERGWPTQTWRVPALAQ
ncbi:MAG: HAD-IB family hydrolase [Burkholderiales bacterium]|nr:HAD-IB family hydrolase [Burkholderiales bacterium]